MSLQLEDWPEVAILLVAHSPLTYFYPIQTMSRIWKGRNYGCHRRLFVVSQDHLNKLHRVVYLHSLWSRYQVDHYYSDPKKTIGYL